MLTQKQIQPAQPRSIDPYINKQTQFQNLLNTVNPVTKRTYNDLIQNTPKKTNPIKPNFQPPQAVIPAKAGIQEIQILEMSAIRGKL